MIIICLASFYPEISHKTFVIPAVFLATKVACWVIIDKTYIWTWIGNLLAAGQSYLCGLPAVFGQRGGGGDVRLSIYYMCAGPIRRPWMNHEQGLSTVHSTHVHLTKLSLEMVRSTFESCPEMHSTQLNFVRNKLYNGKIFLGQFPCRLRCRSHAATVRAAWVTFFTSWYLIFDTHLTYL